MSAPPPDFRLVWLDPSPVAGFGSLAAASGGLATFGAGSVLSGGHPAALAAAAFGGLAVAAAITKLGRAVPRSTLASAAAMAPASMAIVPWGVLVHRDELRVLRWSAITRVSVEQVFGKQGARSLTRWSVVTVRTERESYGGWARGAVPLDQLERHLDAYTREAERPVALDLEGTTSVVDIALEPTCEQLVAEARRLLHTGELSESLGLAPSSYRAVARELAPHTHDALLRCLDGSESAAADPRPLAMVLAAELGAERLAPSIAKLRANPHPIVAAVARAAALRLGCDVGGVGSLEELAEFLPAADLDELQRWARTRTVVPRAGARKAGSIGLEAVAVDSDRSAR